MAAPHRGFVNLAAAAGLLQVVQPAAVQRSPRVLGAHQSGLLFPIITTSISVGLIALGTHCIAALLTLCLEWASLKRVAL